MKLPAVFNLFRRKQYGGLSPVDYYNQGWTNVVREPYTGAWQQHDRRHMPLHGDALYSNSTIFRCITLIAADIAKMRLKLVEEDANDIWQEIDSPAFGVIIKPNDYQNRIQFFEHWLISKLTCGNTFVLKGRDNRNVVTALYILDPHRIKPMVAPDGAVFYQAKKDLLSGLTADEITIPSDQIIHDRMNTLFHPLVGLSPIYAAALAASQSLRIQAYSDRFFANWSRPSGILTAPGVITKDTAERIKNEWGANFSGDNTGKIAALGDGLKFEPMAQDAVDSQLVEQLQWSAKTIASTFGIPGYKLGIEAPPAYNNVEAINQEYYSQALQIHIESIELALDEGLELPSGYGTEFDLDGLLRMDTATMVKSIADSVKAGVMTPNEGRKRIGLSPVAGGDSPYLQQQNYSLAALDKRDSSADPFAAASKPQPQQLPTPANENPAQQAAQALAAWRKEFAHV